MSVVFEDNSVLTSKCTYTDVSLDFVLIKKKLQSVLEPEAGEAQWLSDGPVIKSLGFESRQERRENFVLRG